MYCNVIYIWQVYQTSTCWVMSTYRKFQIWISRVKPFPNQPGCRRMRFESRWAGEAWHLQWVGKCHVFHELVDLKNPHHFLTVFFICQKFASWRYTKDAAREVRLQRLHEALECCNHGKSGRIHPILKITFTFTLTCEISFQHAPCLCFFLGCTHEIFDFNLRGTIHRSVRLEAECNFHLRFFFNQNLLLAMEARDIFQSTAVFVFFAVYQT